MKNITIAIDGFSSTGKSTLAKNLAKALSYSYVDTGAMYRTVALFAVRNGWLSAENIQKDRIIQSLDKVQISFQYHPETEINTTFLNGEDVESEIRSMRVSKVVTKVSSLPEVRKAMVSQQKEMGRNKGVVMDGRDIGTVVFPDAELKIFMTADPEIRAERRFSELKGKGVEVSFSEVMENLKERDTQDINREEGPLKQAADALVLDNSKLSLDAQFKIALNWAEERIKE